MRPRTAEDWTEWKGREERKRITITAKNREKKSGTLSTNSHPKSPFRKMRRRTGLA
jgi:hypothetical protein